MLERSMIGIAACLALAACGNSSDSGSDSQSSAGGSVGSGGSAGRGGSAGASGTGAVPSGGASGAGTGGTGLADSGPSAGGAPSGTDAASGSRCEETPTQVTCPKNTLTFGAAGREVHFQVPLGAPPASGFKTVLMFQGSLFSAELSWSASQGMPFGAYNQTLVVKQLLDRGFAVITPETKGNGGTFWDTNVPPASQNWEASDDHAFMLEIFAALDAGRFGPLDRAKLYATGISSGGYMSSRMAIAYPGRFSSIAVQSASYASCSGPICSVPALDAQHPPTLLLHGRLDVTVPLATAEAYQQKLEQAGVATRLVVDDAMGHAWIPAAPEEVAGWFELHP